MQLWAKFSYYWRIFRCSVFGHRYSQWKEWTPAVSPSNPFLSQPTEHRYCLRCGVVEFNLAPPKHWNCQCTYTFPLTDSPSIDIKPIADLCDQCEDQLTCPTAYDTCPFLPTPQNSEQPGQT